jgi:RNA polymerase sigma factor (sigma-70 family)
MQKFNDSTGSSKVKKSSAVQKGMAQEETRRLIKIYQTSTDEYEREDAANQIIKGNDSLVTYMLRRYFPTYLRGNSFEDLMQEGRMGLFEAIKTYDPEKGTFSTHATFSILHNMYKLTGQDNNSTIYYQTQAKQYKSAVSALSADGNIYPSITDVADKMKVGIEAVQRVMNVMARANHISIDGHDSLGNAIADPLKASPLDIAIENEEKEALITALKQLNREQRFVIEQTYYSDDEKTKTLTEIGKLLGNKKPEDVKRIRQSALRTLNRALTKAGFGKGAADAYDELASSIKVQFHSANGMAAAEIEIIELG